LQSNFRISNVLFTFKFQVSNIFVLFAVYEPLDLFEIERGIVARDQEFFVRDREVRDKRIKSAYRVHKCPRDRAFCSR